ncbi:extracellular solute-binding protein [Paenibacillus doosanensis]|uniref:Lipoprotein LipO n=1 Tax=Paenibacillus konkukensis TaxID=2020716 RepID=A0ABY4RUR0_9BACL|nr:MULTISPECIES: extracellular solute-binding protein [Paenibacillus]MCS7460772.1 extracellular solute-binding protein [Paenibacillus doosanensis]UQZ85953.1 Lipoprotein LipO precursor [Paenibacillus konkukensis]
MKSKNRRRMAAGSLALILTMSGLLAACGKNSSKDQAGASGPLEVSVMTILLSASPPAADNPIKKAIEEATNSKLNIQWVSGNNYTDKLNVTLASGDIPDLVTINDPFSSVFRNAVSQGAFWDLTPYYKEYPNLGSKISDTAWELTKMQDGKNYGIPRPRPAEADQFLVIRKDWLDNLGLKVPTTTDELYTVMKAFAEKDPDKNGKNDTIPFAAYLNAPSDMASLGAIENSFTGANVKNDKWKLQDGKIVNTAFLPETRTAIEYMTNMYKDKLIPEDFASMKLSQASDLFKAGKAGMIVEKAGTMNDYYEKLKKVDPNFKPTDFYPITSINGFNPKGPGFSGMLSIPKSVPEAKMKQILKLVDTWMNDDVFAIQQYGFEGTHYTVQDGQKVINTEKLAADNGPDFNQIVYVADPYASSTKVYFPKDANDLFKSIQDERAKTSVADISTGLYSPTAVRALPEFEKKAQDLKTKIILGREPITAWDDFTAKMKNDPDIVKMSQELTEAYQKRAGGK